MFEEFENLLRNKEFGQLDESERMIVDQFAASSAEYNSMRRIMLDSRFLADEVKHSEIPAGGADQVWARFEAQKDQEKRASLINRKVPVSWVAGLAAALVISWLIRFPGSYKVADPVMMQMSRPVLVQAEKTDTVFRDVPVYIQSEPVVIVERLSNAVPSGGMVYMQPVKSASEQMEQRQGTNATEMGDLAKLTVAVN